MGKTGPLAKRAPDDEVIINVGVIRQNEYRMLVPVRNSKKSVRVAISDTKEKVLAAAIKKTL